MEGDSMETMKTTIPILLSVLILCGCASEKNPLMTGNPKDWRRHPTSDLVTACGQPTRILQQSDGEVWQYIGEWEAEVPKGSHMLFDMRASAPPTAVFRVRAVDLKATINTKPITRELTTSQSRRG